MIRRMNKRIRQLLRAAEARRRDERIRLKMANESGTWTQSRWMRAIRYSDRMYRLANGASPWREYRGY